MGARGLRLPDTGWGVRFVAGEGRVAQAQWLRVGRNSQTSLLTPNTNLKVELQPRNEKVKQSGTYKRVYFLQPRGHTM